MFKIVILLGNGIVWNKSFWKENREMRNWMEREKNSGSGDRRGGRERKEK